jgi:excisionase family DNA binding protein
MNGTPATSEWLTVKEAAAYLNISESLVYAMVDDQCFDHARFGKGRGTIRIRLTALEQFIEERTVPKRGTLASKPRASAPSAFRQLNAAKLREAWAEQGVE